MRVNGAEQSNSRAVGGEILILFLLHVLGMEAELDPRENIGKPYQRGMLPYGGGVGRGGLISFVVTKEEFDEKMRRLKSIQW